MLSTLAVASTISVEPLMDHPLLNEPTKVDPLKALKGDKIVEGEEHEEEHKHTDTKLAPPVVDFDAEYDHMGYTR